MNDSRTILGAGVEDYAGLWEAVWELRSVHPEQTTESLVATAREILMSLLSAHQIELYWCQEPYGDTTLIPDGEAPGLLNAPGAFDEPTEDAISVRFSATPAGEDLYRKLWEQP